MTISYVLDCGMTTQADERMDSKIQWGGMHLQNAFKYHPRSLAPRRFSSDFGRFILDQGKKWFKFKWKILLGDLEVLLAISGRYPPPNRLPPLRTSGCKWDLAMRLGYVIVPQPLPDPIMLTRFKFRTVRTDKQNLANLSWKVLTTSCPNDLFRAIWIHRLANLLWDEHAERRF